MPYITINSASLYYETFGKDHPDRVPILLIHGSPNTGQYDWRELAPLLAQHYYLIVPDCRGHGKSANPQLTYSFKEMADDAAQLIRALGYQRAHIVGHSNGGNIALVTLVEHPDVVQSCVIQAANAYVSPDLLDREPHIFDPDRVERENPEWMNEMIEQHGSVHGANYWRDLLKITLHAILTEPNYQPNDLAKVSRPTLAIQGANDPVNAPSHHAEYIAQHIPHAELWIANTGHNVHKELPFEWVNKILDFLNRRGDDANDALYRLKQNKFKDGRDTIFNLRFELGALTGSVLHQDQVVAAALVVGVDPNNTSVKILLNSSQWGLVIRSVADVFNDPDIGSERVTQVLLGDVVHILESTTDMSRIHVQRDGYLGWIRTSSLHQCSESEARAYTESATAVVIAELTNMHDATNLRIGKIPFGIKLNVIETKNNQSQIKLPNGQICWINKEDLLPQENQYQPDQKGIEMTLSLMERFVGVPYLWGGLSPYGFDCSGFNQTFHKFLGVAIPRDADQQFKIGKVVDETPRPGDSLYFGSATDSRRITHVAISLGGDNFIHAAGNGIGVTYNSFDTESPLYNERLKNIFVGVRRFL